ncbi:craniofacial development 2-like protein [Labeo rohita]|uniref:Craniofacial development 2-like protein n=1 Tax=Labeo rohita TaxID=84645 RepID=A0A498NT86_LABRO|nr:craniofacial development 2-like protein [Labeo rohita]
MVSDGKTILYSGHKRWHMHGVGMMLSKEATSALIGWKPVNDRIITTRFLSQHAKTTIVQVYAPTEDAVETKKDAFYNQLQDVINEVPRHDVTVLCGDFNAQISANQQGLEHVIGPYGTGCHITNNGECLLLFCNTNGLCIGNTFFTHKQIHKKTWCGPNGLTNNKIDYVCVSRRWRSALQDTHKQVKPQISTDFYKYATGKTIL